MQVGRCKKHLRVATDLAQQSSRASHRLSPAWADGGVAAELTYERSRAASRQHQWQATAIASLAAAACDAKYRARCARFSPLV
eukprot:COSAG01_NODE_2373_length_7809_cov_20.194034_3_plen_83_part_00